MCLTALTVLFGTPFWLFPSQNISISHRKKHEFHQLREKNHEIHRLVMGKRLQNLSIGCEEKLKNLSIGCKANEIFQSHEVEREFEISLICPRMKSQNSSIGCGKILQNIDQLWKMSENSTKKETRNKPVPNRLLNTTQERPFYLSPTQRLFYSGVSIKCIYSKMKNTI